MKQGMSFMQETEQEYESRVPGDVVSLLRQGVVEKEDENDNLEIWRVKDYQVTLTKNVRAYNCTCRFGSVHGDKDGVCKHVGAVEMLKYVSFVDEDILREIKEENFDDE